MPVCPLAFMMDSEDSEDTADTMPASQAVVRTSPAHQLKLLEDYVSRTLPALPVSSQMEIVKKMCDIGVDTPADLEFVEESDFDTLKKVHLRKLLRDWRTEKESCSEETSNDLSSVSRSTSSSESEPNILGNCSKSSDRAEGTIPWFKMPKELMAALDGGKRPSPSLRKEMVRIIVADLYKPNQVLPRTRAFRLLAQEAVSRYPKSFMDEVDGIKIGTGYDSLLSQFLNRVDNLSRPKPTNMKRKVAQSHGAEIVNKKRDSYGCINWQPMNLPEGETEASQEGMKAQLKEMHKSEPHVEQCQVERLMAKTYASQRFLLNKADCALLDVIEEWPYLLAETHMLLHFKELVGIDIKQKMAEGLEQKSAKVYRFFQQHRSFPSAHQEKIKEAMHAISQACEATANETPKVIGLLYLLSAYFGEPVEQHIIPSQALGQPQDRETLPGHSCLISKGNPLETNKFSLAVGKVVTTDIQNPLSALAMWFASYYTFNLQYPSTAPGVPEFFQRCLLGINPPSGSKKGGKKSKVHSGVMKLANSLTTFESEWSCGQ